jgi:hypothetical protein
LGLLGTIGGYFVNLALESARDRLSEPLTVSLEDRTSSPNYLFPPTVEPRNAPVDVDHPNDAEFRRWAERNDGIPYSDRSLEMVLRGRDAEPVIINDIRAKVIERTAVPREFWLNSWEGCGGVLPVRLLEIDLSQDPPPVKVYIDGSEAEMPRFEVSASDIEVFQVDITGGASVTSWLLEIDYSAAGKNGVREIREADDNPLLLAGGGDPVVFSTFSGMPGLTRDDATRESLREGNPLC